MKATTKDGAVRARRALAGYIALLHNDGFATAGYPTFSKNSVCDFLLDLHNLCHHQRSDADGTAVDLKTCFDWAENSHAEAIDYEQHNAPHTVVEATDGRILKIERGRDNRVISVGTEVNNTRIADFYFDTATASGMYAVLHDGGRVAVSHLSFPDEK